jgi:rhodanese-related sulfurtransferase
MFSSFKTIFGNDDIQQLTPKDLIDLDPDSYIIADVREKWEVEIAALPGTMHIPLGEIYGRINELETYRTKKIVFLCHHGGRSQRAAISLATEGFENVANLKGGIDKWATEIDTNLRRY